MHFVVKAITAPSILLANGIINKITNAEILVSSPNASRFEKSFLDGPLEFHASREVTRRLRNRNRSFF